LAKKSIKTMVELAEDFGDQLVPYKLNDTIETEILDISPRKMLVDVMGLAVGVVPEAEYSFDTIEYNKGDKIALNVLSMENDDGYVILSHKRANREALWETLKAKSEAGEIMSVKVSGANRGGLLVEAGGIDGFIPVSQLAPEHYPKVQNSSGGEIARRLQEFIGQTFKVKVLNVDKTTNKLIFSEKAVQGIMQDSAVDTATLGDKMEATVTGIASFGLFVNADGIEGLVHISEISWDRVTDINTMFNFGQRVKVKVIQIERNRISFSIKRMQPDPWIKAYDDYKPGAQVEGEVTRLTNFGAFVKISNHVAGLCHVSQMGEGVSDPKDVVTIGKKYKFEIVNIEPSTHRCSLTMVQELSKPSKNKKPKEKTVKKPTKTKKPLPTVLEGRLKQAGKIKVKSDTKDKK